MTSLKKIALCMVIVASHCVSAAVVAEEPVLSSEKEKLSYAIGLQAIRNIKRDGTAVDIDWVVRGLLDGDSGKKPLLTEPEVKKIMQALMADMRQKMAANKQEAAIRNQRRGLEFLKENESRSDIKSLQNGVQYRVIKSGGDKKPSDSDTVLCNYRGTLLDGKEFDGSTPGKPALLQVAKMIPGVREALKNMGVGAKWQLFIPAALAYGERGVGADIGPNETLQFEIELLEIK